MELKETNMEGKEVFARLNKLAQTNVCDKIDEGVVETALSSLGIIAKVVCGTVYVYKTRNGGEVVAHENIHDVAKQLCETLNIPLVPA